MIIGMNLVPKHTLKVNVMKFRTTGKPRKTFAIIGLGRFGSAVARTLAENGQDLIIIDKNPDRVRELRCLTDYAYVVGHLDQLSLEEIGVGDCEAAIVAIGSAIDANILASLYCLNLHVPRVIAKANSKDQGQILEKIGAEVIYPEQDMGIRLANQLSNQKVIDYFSVSGNIDIAQIAVPEFFVGKTLKNLELRQKYGISIVAIQKKDQTIEEIDPNYVFARDDIIIIIGSNENIHNFERSVSE